jgi:Flp pilus assembly protein TadD
LKPDAQALSFRGYAHAMLGRQAEAVADYTRALALKPDDPILYHARGESSLALGRLDEAVADATRAVFRGSRHPRVGRHRIPADEPPGTRITGRGNQPHRG